MIRLGGSLTNTRSWFGSLLGDYFHKFVMKVRTGHLLSVHPKIMYYFPSLHLKLFGNW